jgi:Mg/Co/Ni transporter MgtE
VKNRKIVKAADVMNATYIELDGLTTVQAAIDAVKVSKAQVIIVSRRKDDPSDPYGIVSLHDIVKKVLAKGRSPERVNIYEIMSKPVISVPPTLDVRYCAQLFDRFDLSYAPVMQEDRLMGVVGYTDLVLNGLCEPLAEPC